MNWHEATCPKKAAWKYFKCFLGTVFSKVNGGVGLIFFFIENKRGEENFSFLPDKNTNKDNWANIELGP